MKNMKDTWQKYYLLGFILESFAKKNKIDNSVWIKDKNYESQI